MSNQQADRRCSGRNRSNAHDVCLPFFTERFRATG
jgi:hypothetical protein